MINVEFVCDIDTAAGYAAHARSMLKAFHIIGLENSEINLKLVIRRKETSIVNLTDEEKNLITHYSSKEMGKPDIRVFFEPAQWVHFEEGVKTISFCQWETTKIRDFDVPGRPTLNWKKQLNLSDMVLTSSYSAIAAYKNSGIVAPMAVIPGPIFPLSTTEELPINGITRAGKASTIIHKENRPIVIGYMAQWCPRKNIEAFIRDVTIGFTRGQVVGLIKTYKSNTFREDDNLVEAAKIVKDSCRKNNGPEFVLITEKLSDLEVEQFFNTIDIYYCPSRGEGFNIPASMAAINNVPVIASSYGGHADFIKPSKNLIGGSYSPAIGMGVYDSDQFWFNIDEADAINRLQKVVRNKSMDPELFLAEAEESKVYISSHFGPTAFVQAFVKAIKDTYAGPLGTG